MRNDNGAASMETLYGMTVTTWPSHKQGVSENNFASWTSCRLLFRFFSSFLSLVLAFAISKAFVITGLGFVNTMGSKRTRICWRFRYVAGGTPFAWLALKADIDLLAEKMAALARDWIGGGDRGLLSGRWLQYMSASELMQAAVK